MNMMNNMIGPIGMLLAGMVIAEVPLKTVFNRKRNYVSTALRLIVYPIFVLFLMKIICAFIGIMDAKQILLTVYLASVTPACATVTSMAQLYDKDGIRQFTVCSDDAVVNRDHARDGGIV